MADFPGAYSCTSHPIRHENYLVRARWHLLCFWPLHVMPGMCLQVRSLRQKCLLPWTLWSWGWCYWNLLASEKRWREHGSNYKLEHRFGRPTFSPLWAGMSESRPGILYFWRCQLNRENDGFGDFTVSLTVSPSSVGPHMIQMFQKEKMLGAGRGFRDDPGRVNQPHSAWGPCSQMPVKFWICYSLTLSPACKLLHLSKPLFPVS